MTLVTRSGPIPSLPSFPTSYKLPSTTYAIALISLSSMTTLLHMVGRIQVNRDIFKQKRFLTGTAFFIIGSLILLCLILQTKKTRTQVKECESLYEKMLEMLEIFLSFKRLDRKLSALIIALLAWALYLLALCEKNLRIFLASCKKLLKIRG